MNDLQHPTEDLTTPAPGSKTKRDQGRSLFEIFPKLRLLKHTCDFIVGSRDEPPPGYTFLASPWWMGIWWGVLAGLILLFCGQTSKFIYIDF